ncbi:MAG: hypothetical protein M3N23_07025 [Pseudomonadota bacterium]|nr:hypothetical protein [Pseudomonadota bacterium]
MHFEPPNKTIGSIKEFALHYAMIVLSILTALGLEQALVTVHHKSEARQAKSEIEHEIAENEKAVGDAIVQTKANLTIWKNLLEKGRLQYVSGKSDPPQSQALLQEALANYSDALPALRTTAWDAAFANQSVTYLDTADLRRFSDLYAVQKFLTQASFSLAVDSASRNFNELTLAIATNSGDPRQTVEILNGRVILISIINSHLAQLNNAYKEKHKPAH